MWPFRSLSNAIQSLNDAQKKKRNLAELCRLNTAALEDVGLFEFKRAELVRRGWGKVETC